MKHFSLTATVNDLKYLQRNDFLADKGVIHFC